MKLSARVALVAAMASVPVSASASGMTADELRSACHDAISIVDGIPNAIDRAPNAVRGINYIDGLLDMLGVWNVVRPGTSGVCLPASGFNINQACRVFIKQVEADPAVLHLGGHVMFWEAMLKAYPCAK